MSLPIEGASAWRASLERATPIRAADPLGSGATFSPWQALMASAALANAPEGAGNPSNGWRARIETGPPTPPSPVVDDPERIETAEAKEPKPAAPNPGPPGLFEDGDFSLADLVDVINPLQHIPIVSTIYRELTGDRIGHGARLAGGVLFMGPFGGLSALANVVLVEASGKDLGEHALALFKDDPAQGPVLAANADAPTVGGPHADSKPAAIADEKALAELLPPGAIPLGRSAEFTQAALRPAALAPASPSLSVADDLPPPPPPGPIAGPGWKGFYSPPENAASRTDSQAARRAYAPDPMAALAAKRTPGAMVGALAAPSPAPGSLAAEGGWFSDAMLAALAKYEEARRLRGPQAPEAARQGAVNIVN
jgi:hypothetical protein